MVTKSLAIHLLGDFRVSVGSRAIDEREWTLRKVKSLVKLLALAPHHRLHREHIMDRLWHNLGPEDGANNCACASCIAPSRPQRRQACVPRPWPAALPAAPTVSAGPVLLCAAGDRRAPPPLSQAPLAHAAPPGIFTRF